MRHRAVAIAFAVITFAMTASPAAAAQLPVVYNGTLGYAHASPTASPPGANNWSCKPSAAHPMPVILVHGTFADMSDSWQALSPLLYDNGYCVFALNYGSYNGSGSLGVYATGDIAQSAEQLSTLREQGPGRDRRQEGRPRRSLAGRHDAALLHQVPRRGLEGEHARRASRRRTTARRSTACSRSRATSRVAARSRAPTVRRARSRRRDRRFITNLNAGGETAPGVNYTVIESDNDEVVTPYTSAFLAPAPNVTNILLQSQCSLDQGEHLSMPYDHIADADVLTALDPGASAASGVHAGAAGVRRMSARPLSGRSWRSRGATAR